jgi:hypothetical protein
LHSKNKITAKTLRTEKVWLATFLGALGALGALAVNVLPIELDGPWYQWPSRPN